MSYVKYTLYLMLIIVILSLIGLFIYPFSKKNKVIKKIADFVDYVIESISRL
jgi:cell division protein FtsL